MTEITITPRSTHPRSAVSITEPPIPARHASSHATGGTDALTPAAIGAATAASLDAEVQARVDLGTSLVASITAESAATAASLDAEVQARVDLGTSLVASITAESAATTASLALKADAAATTASLASITAESAATTASLALKADAADTISALALKADAAATTASLALKAGLSGGNTLTGQQLLTTSAVGVPTLIVKLLASQTADPLQVQNSAGTVLAKITNEGMLHAPRAQIDAPSDAALAFELRGGVQRWSTTGGSTLADMTSGVLTAKRSILSGTSASDVVSVVKAYPSQTADAFQVQDSAGTVLAKITSAGWVESYNVTSATTYGSLRPGSVSVGATGGSATSTLTAVPNAASYISNKFGLRVENIAGTTLYPTLIAKLVASQTADAFQAQDSASVVLAKITAAGDVHLDHNSATMRVHGHASSGLNRYVDIQGFDAYGASAIRTNATRIDLDGSSGVLVRSTTQSLSGVSLIVQTRASQTGDAFQVQDSAGTVLANITTAGALKVGYISGYPTTLGGNTLDVRDNLLLTVAGGANSGLIVKPRNAVSGAGTYQKWESTAGVALLQVTANADLDFVATGRGPILVAPNATRYRLGVDSTGALTTTAVA